MVVQAQPALEFEEQILAPRTDSLDAPVGELLGQRAQLLGPALDCQRAAAAQLPLQPLGAQQYLGSFGHGGTESLFARGIRLVANSIRNGWRDETLLMERIPESVWLRPIEGLHLKGASLDAELEGPARLLVFLRHFG
jgi:hypothetical protein